MVIKTIRTSLVLDADSMVLPGGSDSEESACNAGHTWVQPLGWEDPLEKEMATLSSILAWRIPWMLIIIQLIFIIHRFYICTFAAK